VLLSVLACAQDEGAPASWLNGHDGDEDSLRGSGPDDAPFLEWAVSPRAHLLLSLTPQWWQSPITRRLHYEDLIAAPNAEFGTLLDRCEVEPLADLGQAVADNAPARLRPAAVGGHAWPPARDRWRKLLAPATVDILMDAHRAVMIDLGYDPDDRALG
jgi:hypothetical protein